MTMNNTNGNDNNSCVLQIVDLDNNDTPSDSIGNDIDDASSSMNSIDNNNQKKKGRKKKKEMASYSKTFSFIFECGIQTRVCFFVGVLASVGVGLIYPSVAFIISQTFTDLSNASAQASDMVGDVYDDSASSSLSPEGQVNDIAYRFMVVGTIALILATLEGMCFEILSQGASKKFRIDWFHALLRQDSAFFDIHNDGNISGIATMVGSNAIIYKRGIGKKLGEGIEAVVTFVAGIVFAFYSSWKTSLLIIGLIPIISIFSMMSIQIQQQKNTHSQQAYKQAATIAHSTVSSIKTVLSLNAVEDRVEQYKDATQQAYAMSKKQMIKEGFVSGAFTGSMTLLFGVLTLYGSYLLYTNVEATGCDPSGSSSFFCIPSGQDILGSLLGIIFASQSLSQVTNMMELLVASRIAVHEALQAIDRKTGSSKQLIYQTTTTTPKNEGDTDDEDDNANNKKNDNKPTKRTSKRRRSKSTIEETETVVKAILPKYEINSMELSVKDLSLIKNDKKISHYQISHHEDTTTMGDNEDIHDNDSKGDDAMDIKGKIVFDNVHFFYPTRPNQPILQGLSLEMEAGKTIALVGPSGGGKSTILSLVERFYDVTSGKITIDDKDIKDLNVAWLRKNLIGYVNQEPTLFATTIYQNIQYGNLNATKEQIERAAKMANAHDFICNNLPFGYQTMVGDKGSQLSGGQKQRIAIARILVGNPKILLLDEATSALDCESELVVQDALDNIFLQQKKKITTIIVAHRLSTIRKADTIAVIVGGKIVEKGTHAELMNASSTGGGGYYLQLVNKQELPDATTSTATTPAGIVATNSQESTDDELQRKGQPEQQEQQDAIEASCAEQAHATKLPSSPLPEITILNENNNDVTVNTACLVHDEDDLASSHHISFTNVRFAFPTRPSKIVLNNFNLCINQGETLALVGPSGGGKSTIVSLIERFYDPNEGLVKYFGHDVKSLNVQWFRDQIGYVGQEPSLFNDTIENNIAYGVRGDVSKAEIVEAARQANAHDFITSFPDGYGTQVGESGAQLSGGQKQRIAIARALVKKPKVLILDEATSALDNDSEAIVQAALDKLMASRDHTTVVIAHRLSTVRNVDRIAVISDGQVVESGSHDELVAQRDGRYKRLLQAQKRVSTIESVGLLSSTTNRLSSSPTTNGVSPSPEKVAEEKDDNGTEDGSSVQSDTDSESKAFSLWRARSMAAPDIAYIALGGIGAIGVGGTYPAWGILFGFTINLLFQRVVYCDDNIIQNVTSSFQDYSPYPPVLSDYDVCEHYWAFVAEDMRERSFWVSGYWFILTTVCILSHALMFYGFSTASERLNKRVRDQSFIALVRQEVGFFDKQSVGKITTQLQDDAAQIHAFSGEPVRTFLIAISSVFLGVLISLIFMWPFALLLLCCLPLMAFSSKVKREKTHGDASLFKDDNKDEDDNNSPGGIAVETLLNMRTVSALGLEWVKFESYKDAILQENPNYVKESFFVGFRNGLGLFIRHWTQGLQFFWGGFLLVKFSDRFEFSDFLFSNFALIFSTFGLATAFSGLSDRKDVEEAAERVFRLLDRQSQIDPLSEEGVKLD